MNAFLNIADAQTVSPVKARQRAAEKRAVILTPEEKKQREQQILHRRWKAWHREKAAALLEGPHGKDIRGLQSFIDMMTLSSSAALLKLVGQSTWLRNADAETRAGVLSIIGHGIMKLRERNGLPPFDDALMDEPPTVFQEIRGILR